MHRLRRFLSVPLALAVVAVLLPSAALAASQPLLTGDQLFYSNARAGETPPPHLATGVGTLTMASTCDPGDTGSFSSLVGTGNANGPYPGTFEVLGAAGMTGTVVDSLGLTFEIRDLVEPTLVVATGALALDPAGPAPDGSCSTIVDIDAGETIVVWQAGGFATYSATVSVGGTLTPEFGYARWFVACITINAEPACDSSETIDIQFLGATLPRTASGEGAAQTAPAATADDPIATSVVSPAGGTVYISESDLQPYPANAYVFLGRQVNVDVSTEDGEQVFGTVEAPINLTFMVDASLLGGIDWQTVTVMRDEIPAPDCSSPDPSTGLSDPEAFCVSSRTLDGTGDLTLVILSLHASTWSVVAPDTSPQYVLTGFSKPVDNPGENGTRNVVKAGQAVPLGWRLTDSAGAPVINLTEAHVMVAGFDCGLNSTADLSEEVASGKSGLQNLGDGYYRFNWKSPKSYANSCKELTLTLSVDGQTITSTALFQFKK